MRLIGFGLVSALLSGVCFATTAQAQSLPTPAPPPTPTPTPTPVYSAPLQPLPPSPRSPQLLEADRLSEQAQQAYSAPQEALKLRQQALKLYQQAGDVDSQFSTLLEISACHYRLYEDRQAIAIAQRAILLAQNSKVLQLQQGAFQFSSHLYEKLGNREAAIAAQKQALAIARQIGSRNELAALRDLGAQCIRLEQYPAAIIVYQQSLDIQTRSGAPGRYERLSVDPSEYSPEIDALMGLINAYTALGQLEKAKSFEGRLIRRIQAVALMKSSNFPHSPTLAGVPLMQEAVRLNRELGDRAGEALVLLRLSKGYAALKQPAVALETAEQALELLRPLNNPGLKSTGLRLVGDLQLQFGQFLQAIAAYQKLETIAQEQKDSFTQRLALSKLVEAYQAIGQVEKARAARQKIAMLPRNSLSFNDTSTSLLPPHFFLIPILYRPPLAEKNDPQVSQDLPDREGSGLSQKAPLIAPLPNITLVLPDLSP